MTFLRILYEGISPLVGKSEFSPLEHELIPEHVLLSEKEVEKILKRYRVKPYQLPHIKSSDPIVQFIGAKPGDVVRILRKSWTAGEATAYRYVVGG